MKFFFFFFEIYKRYRIGKYFFLVDYIYIDDIDYALDAKRHEDYQSDELQQIHRFTIYRQAGKY